MCLRDLELEGLPITIEYCPDPHAWRGRLVLGPARGSPVHASSFLRDRRIVLAEELRRHPQELLRIYTHELFHFTWLRLGNPLRREYERLLVKEWRDGAGGELGWSAEVRKLALKRGDITARSRRWREYACESFCDTAAWRFTRPARHLEFTLPAACRRARARWFEAAGLTRLVPV